LDAIVGISGLQTAVEEIHARGALLINVSQVFLLCMDSIYFCISVVGCAILFIFYNVSLNPAFFSINYIGLFGLHVSLILIQVLVELRTAAISDIHLAIKVEHFLFFGHQDGALLMWSGRWCHEFIELTSKYMSVYIQASEFVDADKTSPNHTLSCWPC
jgi:hypothetical protein